MDGNVPFSAETMKGNISYFLGSGPKVTIELPRCRKVNISKLNISPRKRGKETVRTSKDGGKVKFQTF
jgi:hypothetical protein